MTMRSAFSRAARMVSRASGHPTALFLSIALVAVWAACGPRFEYSDTWQLVINTGTTIVTFLMVFLIQNTQNRDTDAIQIKLNEIIRALEGAHNAMVSLEDMEEEQLVLLRHKYSMLAEQARRGLLRGDIDTAVAEVALEDCGVSGGAAATTRKSSGSPTSA